MSIGSATWCVAVSLAGRLSAELRVNARVQLPFEYATAAGPSRWIWAAGEVTYGYRFTGPSMDSNSTSNGT